MRKNCLTGLLLGVSMALLLAGGVAVANGPTVTVDPTTGYYGTTFKVACTNLYPFEPHEQSFILPDAQIEGPFDLGSSDSNGDVDCWGWQPEPPEPLGVWTVVLVNTERQEEYTATFEVLAEEEEEEFVPEPGTILLLGSGLAGLAGYAGLRWRTRE